MTHEANKAPQHLPGLRTWLLWTLLTILGDLVSKSIFLFYNAFNAMPWLNDASVWTFLALPLFFVSLGQWLVLRRLITWAGWWLLTGLLGLLFLLPYFFFYAFSDEYSSGQSLSFGTTAFWNASLTLALLSLVFGGIVGLVQGLLVLRRYGSVPGQWFWWMIGSALAWGIGYPLGQQVIGSMLVSFPSFFSFVAIEGTTWGIIGAITGAIFVWLRPKQEFHPFPFT